MSIGYWIIIYYIILFLIKLVVDYTLIALAGSGPEGASLRALANSIDGSDGLLEPLFAGGETNPVLAYQIQTNPSLIDFKKQTYA